ncbi:aldehyde dehydrogenase (NADP(+)) [Balneatrix alpica]|uniref:aldehyde dehydrogenase (NADP(+)) n=1 Tax=Balneatrix alpica TaxID=75684 RepID=UPI0027396AE2|nr:aldehyde dehydrogenase (NADP(+)) [Balneatrix alpica]
MPASTSAAINAEVSPIATGQLINGQWQRQGDQYFQAANPATDTLLPERFYNASQAELDLAVSAAQQAFADLATRPAAFRATLLARMAQELEQDKAQIIERAVAETALAPARIEGELGRTCGQLRLFANLLNDGNWQAPVIDSALPERQPLPRPDLRLSYVALGPVAVYSASNFPLAFSVAGGDSASALAAGCPVIVKGHPAHPGTSALVAEALRRALQAEGAHPGCFALLQSNDRHFSHALIRHPGIAAGGFTGSVAAGRDLFNSASQRPHPIPFYGELGSTNPVFILPGALRQDEAKLAQGLAASITQGAGQFCTNPGLVIALRSKGLERLLKHLSEAISQQSAQTMLSKRIWQSYQTRCEWLAQRPGLQLLAQGQKGGVNQAQAQLLKVSASQWLAQPDLEEENFGPSSLVIECESETELLAVAARLHGHLTATLHLQEHDHSLAAHLCPILANKVGRILANGFPTGVEVCHAMQHGGPYPASSDSRSTSVGSRAILRFVRPLCWQNMPDALLPEALQADNPQGLVRLIDGCLSGTQA